MKTQSLLIGMGVAFATFARYIAANFAQNPLQWHAISNFDTKPDIQPSSFRINFPLAGSSYLGLNVFLVVYSNIHCLYIIIYHVDFAGIYS